jgi:Bd3614-like deaminase
MLTVEDVVSEGVFASVKHEGVCYRSMFASLDSAFPATPVFSLIWNLYHHFGENSLRILRRPIVTNYPPTELCRATVKVAAKRLGTMVENSAEEGAIKLLNDPVFAPSAPDLLGDFFAEMMSPPKDTWQSGEFLPMYQRNRNVRARLIDKNHKVLFEHTNTNNVCKVQHAEINLVLGWWQSHNTGFPEGARLQVTLKPCKMCAAFVLNFCRRSRGSIPPISIEYLRDDPGPMAQNTCYDQLGLITKMNT